MDPDPENLLRPYKTPQDKGLPGRIEEAGQEAEQEASEEPQQETPGEQEQEKVTQANQKGSSAVVTHTWEFNI